MKLGIAISLVIGGVIASGNCTLAQIVPDGTLGTESSVVTNVVVDGIPSTQIDGKATQGGNLFHSFQEFNVGEGQTVYFTNPPDINNILSRVTGGNRSQIQGKLSVLGNANLFLINPNGIIFGPKASLDVKGSFLASTASSLNFADGTQFSATATQTSPLLTVSVPIGLQFGRTARGIRVQESILQVQPGKTLGLLGGDVTLEGGTLAAPGGRIELGSVASNNLVSLNPTEKGWFLGYDGIQNFQNIQLIKGSFNEFASEVGVNGEGGGDIQVQGRQVALTDGSQIRIRGVEIGGNLTVTASESVELIGSSSSLSSSTTSAGDAGNITINTGRLLLSDGASVSVESASTENSSGQITPATGQAGNLTVNASESVELRNGSAISSLTQGSGDAGRITIITGELIVRNRSGVDVSSLEMGDAGDLEVTVRSLNLDNQGRLNADTASGSGGDIKLRVGSLHLRHNSNITTNAGDNATGGNITINTDTLVGLEDSNIAATAIEGEGGFIQITAQGIFGLEVSEQDSENSSDITAFSRKNPSLNGEIEINRPETDISSGLVTLPTELVDISELIAQGCSAGGGNTARGASKFVATGRGGLPPTPTEALRSDPALADLGTPIQGDRASAASTNPTNSLPATIVEAQGWVINDNKEVVLVAQAPTVTPHTPWLTSTNCHAP